MPYFNDCDQESANGLFASDTILAYTTTVAKTSQDRPNIVTGYLTFKNVDLGMSMAVVMEQYLSTGTLVQRPWFLDENLYLDVGKIDAVFTASYLGMDPEIIQQIKLAEFDYELSDSFDKLLAMCKRTQNIQLQHLMLANGRFVATIGLTETFGDDKLMPTVATTRMQFDITRLQSEHFRTALLTRACFANWKARFETIAKSYPPLWQGDWMHRPSFEASSKTSYHRVEPNVFPAFDEITIKPHVAHNVHKVSTEDAPMIIAVDGFTMQVSEKLIMAEPTRAMVRAVLHSLVTKTGDSGEALPDVIGDLVAYIEEQELLLLKTQRQKDFMTIIASGKQPMLIPPGAVYPSFERSTVLYSMIPVEPSKYQSPENFKRHQDKVTPGTQATLLTYTKLTSGAYEGGYVLVTGQPPKGELLAVPVYEGKADYAGAFFIH